MFGVGKTGETKKKIIEILERKNGTLTDISGKLGLAPSTVSQHIQELVDAGKIRLVRDRPRKWKYYEINRGDIMPQHTDRWFYSKRVAIPIAIVLLALVSVFAYYSNSTKTISAQQVYISPGSTVPDGSTIFTISDSPTLYNVSSLVITVDNASVYSVTTGKWYKIALQSNSFDLIKLRNVSTVLAGVNLSNGTYDGMIVYVSNVTATINGTKESVYLPSGRLFINSRFNISHNTTNWINMDFNLRHSLHITGNGELIMLPVITVRSATDSNLEFNSSSIVVARAPGRIMEFDEFGMNGSGNMIENFTVCQNASINQGLNGKLIVNNGSGHVPIEIRTEHALEIGDSAQNVVNITGMGMGENTMAVHMENSYTGRFNSSLSPNELDNDLGISTWNNSTEEMFNFSIHNSGGIVHAQCDLQDGGVFCNGSDNTMFGHAVGNDSNMSNSTNGASPEDTGTGIRGGVCMNLTMGNC